MGRNPFLNEYRTKVTNTCLSRVHFPVSRLVDNGPVADERRTEDWCRDHAAFAEIEHGLKSNWSKASCESCSCVAIHPATLCTSIVILLKALDS